MVAVPQAPADAEASPGRARPGATKVLCGLLAFGFFFGPAIAAAAGLRARQIENHKLGRLPSAQDGWHAFGLFDTWATDHLPLRNVAVKANTTVARDVFRETPDYGGSTTTTTASGVGGISVPQPAAPSTAPDIPVVIGGTDGWLYYGTDFRNACHPVQSATVTVQRFARQSDIISRAGKKIVMVIAPDKTDMYPEHLPASYPGSSCTAPAEAALWAALAANPPAGYKDLHGALLNAKKQAPGVSLYRKLDTHWNGRGALLYGQIIADSLDPQLWPTTTVTSLGDRPSITDLEALLGLSTPEKAPAFDVVRPGVVNTLDSAGRVTNTTTDAPLVKAPTLFISDSFTESSRFAIDPFFASVGFINSSAASTAFDALTSAIKGSDVVVFEIVEREIVGGQAPILRTDILDRLAHSLGES
jgi:alginate O-acetyltransferase complex protein AlgJ